MSSLNEIEFKEMGCEEDLAYLKSLCPVVENFDLEGNSLPVMAQHIVDLLQDKKIIFYVAIVYLCPDTPIFNVSDVIEILGGNGVFVSAEAEREALKCVVGVENRI